MKLITTAEMDKLPPLYSQENVDDPVVHVHWFSPYAGWDWYATEAREEPDADVLFFGLVKGMETELGYWRLSDLAFNTKWGVPAVERDLYWTPKKLSEVRDG